MKLQFTFIGIILSLLSCNKDSIDRIPDVYVDYKISYVEFNSKAPNGVLIISKSEYTGVAGLIICKFSGIYKAYDRCSSVNPQQGCAVVPDDNLTATDPCSGAKFSLLDGSPVKAPAKRPLKEYRVINTTFGLTVRN